MKGHKGAEKKGQNNRIVVDPEKKKGKPHARVIPEMLRRLAHCGKKRRRDLGNSHCEVCHVRLTDSS